MVCLKNEIFQQRLILTTFEWLLESSRNLTIMEFGAVVHQMHIWLMGELKEPFQEDFSHIEATVNLTSCDMFEPP